MSTYTPPTTGLNFDQFCAFGKAAAAIAQQLQDIGGSDELEEALRRESALRRAERRRKWRNIGSLLFHLLPIYLALRLGYVNRRNEALRADLAACRQSMQRTDTLLDSQSQKMDSLRRDHALRDSLFQRATGTEFAPLVRAMEYTDMQAGRAKR